MSGVEVTSAFTELTKVYIANAELDYGPGLDYEGTLSWLAANPGASAADFARAEAMLWDAHHREASRVDGFYRSHAAWDMTPLGRLPGRLADAGHRHPQQRRRRGRRARACSSACPPTTRPATPTAWICATPPTCWEA